MEDYINEAIFHRNILHYTVYVKEMDLTPGTHYTLGFYDRAGHLLFFSRFALRSALIF